MYSIGSLGGQVLHLHCTVDYRRHFNLRTLTCDVSVGASGDRHEGDGGWRGQRQVRDRSRAHDPVVHRLQNSFLYVRYSTLLHLLHPSNSTVSEDAGIEPRIVATTALAAIGFNHSARSHTHSARSHPHLIQNSCFILRSPRCWSAVDPIAYSLDFIKNPLITHSQKHHRMQRRKQLFRKILPLFGPFMAKPPNIRFLSIVFSFPLQNLDKSILSQHL